MLDLVLATSARTPDWFITLGNVLLISLLIICFPILEIFVLVLQLVWGLVGLLVRGIVALAHGVRRT